jgi:hypothetical protein
MGAHSRDTSTLCCCRLTWGCNGFHAPSLVPQRCSLLQVSGPVGDQGEGFGDGSRQHGVHVVVNLFESQEAGKAFAGPDYKTPVFGPEAKKLLCRIESVANHYDVRLAV